MHMVLDGVGMLWVLSGVRFNREGKGGKGMGGKGKERKGKGRIRGGANIPSRKEFSQFAGRSTDFR